MEWLAVTRRDRAGLILAHKAVRGEGTRLSATRIAREAVLQQIADLEDLYLAEEELMAVREGLRRLAAIVGRELRLELI